MVQWYGGTVVLWQSDWYSGSGTLVQRYIGTLLWYSGKVAHYRHAILNPVTNSIVHLKFLFLHLEWRTDEVLLASLQQLTLLHQVKTNHWRKLF